MLLRFTHLCLSAVLVAAAALAGCNQPQARFADATPTQVARGYTASSGADLISVSFIGTTFSGQNAPTSCPTVMTAGQDTTVSGGCTTEDGARLDGSIVLHNVPGVEDNPAYNPSQPSSIELDFQVTTPGHEHIALEGRVEAGMSGISGDLTIEAQGITTTSRLTLVCDVHGTCTASPDSEIEISGLGGAGVEGTWSLADQPSGRITVRGADVLVFDLSDPDESSCTPYVLGEQTGNLCTSDLDLGGLVPAPAPIPARAGAAAPQRAVAPNLRTQRFPWL